MNWNSDFFQDNFDKKAHHFDCLFVQLSNKYLNWEEIMLITFYYTDFISNTSTYCNVFTHDSSIFLQYMVSIFVSYGLQSVSLQQN